MQDERDLIRAVAPQHASYWRAIAADGYLGGPIADRSGGLITFEARSRERAERMTPYDVVVVAAIFFVVSNRPKGTKPHQLNSASSKARVTVSRVSLDSK